MIGCRRRLRALALLFGVVLAAAPAAASGPLPSAAWLLDHVRSLSSPAMDGRASGTEGARRAARHIARAFRDAGLRPGGDSGGYLQMFDVPTGIRLGTPNVLEIIAPGPVSPALGRDFVPLGVSSDGEVVADVVFAGYGITAPDLGYDDYADVDVRGKVVLVVTGEPRGRDPASPFRRPEAYHYSERRHKIINARERGARAVLLVSHPARSEPLALPAGTTPSWSTLAAGVAPAVADRLLVTAATTLADLADAIDRALAPRSRALPGVRVRLAVTLVRERGAAENVVGILPGTDPRLREEAIVIGAHYDHLGRGGEGSLAPAETGAIHHGADDNASGTAAVMALAASFGASGGAPRTLVFVAFAGEEIGLLGSTHYVRRPAFPIDRTVLMVNLDMVGRLRDRKLYAGGVDSGTGLRQVVEAAARGLPLALSVRGDPYAASDHTTFYAARRPVLFLFTGAHEDYHRPGDTWEKINAEGLGTVTELAGRVVAAIARESTPPAYARVERAVDARSRGGYGPFFGVVPEFGEGGGTGVKVSGVRPGSPAEKAGVRAGDVIVRFAGLAVKTLDDLTYALRGQRPGDRVAVVLVRDGREHVLEAELEARR